MYEWLTEVLPYVAGYLVVGATFAWAWVALDAIVFGGLRCAC